VWVWVCVCVRARVCGYGMKIMTADVALASIPLVHI